MGLSSPRSLYGIHSVTPYRLTSDDNGNKGEFFGMLQVLQGSTFSLSGDTVELRGGSNRYNWAVEDGNINAELQLQCSEYPDFLFEIFLGKKPTTTTSDVSGNVSTVTNFEGTTTVSAAGFLGTVTVSTAADLKFGKYVLVATDTDEAKLYKSTNIDDQRGANATEFDDDMLIATFTSVGSGSTHAVSNHGITLTAGASAGNMTVGDTAYFYVRPVTTGGSSTVTIGSLSDVFPSFGVICYTSKKGNGEMMELDIFNLKGIGLNFASQEKQFSNWQVTARASYDSTRGGVFSMRFVKP